MRANKRRRVEPCVGDVEAWDGGEKWGPVVLVKVYSVSFVFILLLTWQPILFIVTVVIKTTSIMLGILKPKSIRIG